MDEREKSAKMTAIENATFIHIPGPNPVLVQGAKNEWDDGVIELCDIFEDDDKYYLYYHGTGQGKSYRVGVAVADHPLGPFRKHGDNPVLDLGPEGAWDSKYVACGTLLKEGVDKYYMWYTGALGGGDAKGFNIGLATAPSPLGPWTRFDGNPLLRDFGYVGGVLRRDGRYYMYNEHPVGVKAADYGTLRVAVADRPEGPWKIRDGAVLPLEEWGTWDDAGYSEANVRFDGAVHHLFYGGAKTYAPRLRSRENIGYAYSFDGERFIKYGKNPVARHDEVPYGAAFAEVCCLFKPPLVYLYHTLRYRAAWRDQDKEKYPNLEHLGCQVLAMSRPFAIDMPALEVDALKPGQIRKDPDRLPFNVRNARSAAVTVSCAFGAGAKKGLLLRVESSPDGYRFDSVPLATFSIDPGPEKNVQRTFEMAPSVSFIRLALENLDAAAVATDARVLLTLKG